MRIAVVGAGGLGGYFGARLCLGGADVRFIARGRHLQAMRDNGLRIVGPEPLHVARVAATDDAGSIGPVDLVMVCVKPWDTDAALEQIRPVVGAQTVLVSFQNGVLKDQALKAAYGDAAVMGGVGYVATTIEQPGVIRQTGSHAAGITAARGVPISSHLMPEASAQVLAASPTCHWLEYVDWADVLLDEPLRIENGFAVVPDRPGIGLGWDERAVARHRLD